MLMQKRQSTLYDDNSDNESGDEYEEHDDFGSHHQTTTTTTTPIMTNTDHNNHVHHGHYTHNNMLIDVASDDYDELISKSLQLSSFTISSTPSSVVERSTTSQYMPNHQHQQHHQHQPVVPQFSSRHHYPQQTEQQQQQYGYYPSSQVDESYGGVTTNYAPFASTHHDTTMTTPTYIHNITPSSTSSLYTNIYNPIVNHHHQLHHSGHNELEQQQQQQQEDNKPFIYPNLSQFVNEEYHEQQDVQFYEMMDRSILVHANPSAPLEYLISVDHTNETMTTTTTTTTTTVKEDEKSKNVEQGEEVVMATIYMTTEEFYKMKQQTEKQGEVAEKRLPAYLYHTLQPDDTLIGIAIGYGITEEQLKMTNNILTELEYFGKPRLLIPHPNRIPDQSLIKEDTESKAKLAEEKKQEWAIKFFVRLKGVSLEEAHYYLSLHDFDLRGAVTEYDADVKWQREYETGKRLKAERKRLEKGDKWSMLDTGKKLLSLLRLCVPIAQGKTSKFIPYSTTRNDDDPYGDLELDEIEENDDDVLDGGDIEQYDAHYPVMHAVNSP